MGNVIKISEHSLQVFCVNWFRRQYPKEIIAAIPNGTATTKFHGRRMKMEGVLKGFPDLFIASPNRLWHGLFIEMKSQNGSAKKEQKEVLQRLQDLGYCAAICKSFDDFKLVVENYFKQNKGVL